LGSRSERRPEQTAFFVRQRDTLGHVERVIYNRYDVTIVGFVPVQAASGDARLPFRIEGKIDIKAVRSQSCRKAALKQLRAASDAAIAATQAESQPVLSPLTANPAVAV
jgi:hypothetical protein